MRGRSVLTLAWLLAIVLHFPGRAIAQNADEAEGPSVLDCTVEPMTGDLDANQWRQSFERISLEKAGEQTFRYLRNIANGYVAYCESHGLVAQRDAARQTIDRR